MPGERPKPKVGGIEFSLYDGRTQPLVSVGTSVRYKTHKPIGADPVKQELGPDLDEITIEGECSVEEANRVDQLKEDAVVEVRTHRFSGLASVDSTDTSPQSKKDAEKGWIHSYTIELTEVSAVSEEGDEEEGTETVTLTAGDLGPVDG
jgi:hypothetical protein